MRIMLLLAIATLLGCAGLEPRPPDPDRCEVVIENHNWNTATVFVAGDGMERRLGAVDRGQVRTFPVRCSRGAVHLRARLLADGQGIRTGKIMVSQGDTVRWTLHAELATSAFTVLGGQ